MECLDGDGAVCLVPVRGGGCRLMGDKLVCSLDEEINVFVGVAS